MRPFLALERLVTRHANQRGDDALLDAQRRELAQSIEQRRSFGQQLADERERVLRLLANEGAKPRRAQKERLRFLVGSSIRRVTSRRRQSLGTERLAGTRDAWNESARRTYSTTQHDSSSRDDEESIRWRTALIDAETRRPRRMRRVFSEGVAVSPSRDARDRNPYPTTPPSSQPATICGRCNVWAALDRLRFSIFVLKFGQRRARTSAFLSAEPATDQRIYMNLAAAAPEQTESTVSHAVPVVVLGTDALLAAAPYTAVQLAHACLQAGYANVVPASWGDELVAAAVLRRLPTLRPGPAIQCSCPIVAHRLLTTGGDLRPVMLPLVSPPVALARYLRAVSHPTRVRITYVGGCPGAVDESIDIRMSPETLIGMLAERADRSRRSAARLRVDHSA